MIPWKIYIVRGGIARVHDTAILEGSVLLAPDVEIGAYAYLRGPISIGAGTKISPHVVIGTDGEHRTKPSVGIIAIGGGVVVREFCAIQRGTGDKDTTIGDRVWLMDRCHVAHDCIVEEDATLSPNVVLGGHTRVHCGATIGISAMTHQHTTVGAYSMIGMGSVVTKDVPPFSVVVGNPARYMRENSSKTPEDPGQREFWNHRFFADRRASRKIVDI